MKEMFLKILRQVKRRLKSNITNFVHELPDELLDKLTLRKLGYIRRSSNLGGNMA